MEFQDNTRQSAENPWKGGDKPAVDPNLSAQRQTNEIQRLIDFTTPLWWQTFKIKDDLDETAVTQKILELLPKGKNPDDPGGDLIPPQMLTNELRVELSTVHPQLTEKNGKEIQRLIVCLNVFETTQKPDGERKERRRSIGMMNARALWFAEHFQPVSPNEFIDDILKQIIQNESAKEKSWQQWLAKQPPPPPPPASVGDVAAIVAKAVAEALKSARA
jgi:hypothetical protein